VIGRPHGVRGLVHVTSYTADPADLTAYGALADDAGRAWSLVWRGAPGVAELRDAQGNPLKDRSAAEKLVNTRLYIERDRLPAPADDEFYLADLVGLTALANGAELGRVTAVHDYGAGASLEIAGQGMPMIIPFTQACVPEIDLAAGRLVINPPAEIAVPEAGAA
jgi:16S rRNA processing protein RimM